MLKGYKTKIKPNQTCCLSYANNKGADYPAACYRPSLINAFVMHQSFVVTAKCPPLGRVGDSGVNVRGKLQGFYFLQGGGDCCCIRSHGTTPKTEFLYGAQMPSVLFTITRHVTTSVYQSSTWFPSFSCVADKVFP